MFHFKITEFIRQKALIVPLYELIMQNYIFLLRHPRKSLYLTLLASIISKRIVTMLFMPYIFSTTNPPKSLRQKVYPKLT